MQGMMCAGHDVLDFQCRHEFWHSNAWTVLTDVPPKELRWPLCTGWTLGWCRMLPMPVSVQSYECCPVVVVWCLMLCHTQCNQSNLERTMARYSIRSVSLPPPHFKWATTRMRLRASWHCVFSTLICFLNERRESHHSPRNFVDSSTGRSVSPILWARDRSAVKCMTLHLYRRSLDTFSIRLNHMTPADADVISL